MKQRPLRRSTWHWFFLFVCLMILLVALWYIFSQNAVPVGSVSIASWNLQIFGDKKESDPALLAFLQEKIAPYDVVFLQEIRDADGSSARRLCALFPQRLCIISDRAGRSNSKEQYVLLLRNDTVVLSWTDFTPELQEMFERPPLYARLSLHNYTFSLVGIHIKPDDAKNEMRRLESLIAEVTDDHEHIVLVGDLNADCSYYNRDREEGFIRWQWLIDTDTTIGRSVCAYDRILLSPSITERRHVAGVDMTGIDSSISDHGLVWVNFSFPIIEE